VVYVAAMEGRTLVALFVFERKTSTRWAVHLAIAPSQWARGEAAFKGAIQWAWENLSVRRIAGEIPADNKHALRLAKRAGFELVGTDKQAFLRGGVLQDVHIVGLSRPQQVQEVAA
jgi:RimJ/RimL family protein N-acetyltransferase